MAKRKHIKTICSAMLIVVLSACQQPQVEGEANPITEAAGALPDVNERCAASVEENVDKLPEALAGADLVGLDESLDEAAESAGIEYPNPTVDYALNDAGDMLIVVGWCADFADRYVYVVDAQGEVWLVYSLSSMTSHDGILAVGDAFALSTDVGSGQHILRVQLIGSDDEGWSVFYNSVDESLVWGSPENLPSVRFTDGYQIMSVTTNGVEEVYRWQDGGYTKIGGR